MSALVLLSQFRRDLNKEKPKRGTRYSEHLLEFLLAHDNYIRTLTSVANGANISMTGVSLPARSTGAFDAPAEVLWRLPEITNPLKVTSRGRRVFAAMLDWLGKVDRRTAGKGKAMRVVSLQRKTSPLVETCCAMHHHNRVTHSAAMNLIPPRPTLRKRNARVEGPKLAIKRRKTAA